MNRWSNLQFLSGKTAKVVFRATGIVFVGTALILFARNIELSKFLSAIQGASLPLIFAAALVNFVYVLCKSLYWKSLVSPSANVGLTSMFRYTLVSIAGSILMPAKAGELARFWLLKIRHQVPYAVSTAVFGLERFFDLLALLVLVIPLPWLMPGLPSWVTKSIEILTGVGVLGIVVLVIGRQAKLFHRFKLLEGFRAVGEPLVVAVGFAGIFGSWLADFVEIVLVFNALSLDIPPATAILVLLAVNLAIAIPALPANAGAHELGTVAALGIVGVSQEKAMAFALVYHLMQVIPVLVVGLIDSRILLVGYKDPKQMEASMLEPMG
jgi:hypothetical protein